MFKKLDKKLLHRFPLLWNLKFPFIVFVGIVFHVLAYFGGYCLSDFSVIDEQGYRDNIDVIIGVFSILGAIILIIWFFYYIRNNGLKAYYPKTQNAIYIEWLLVFCIVFFFLLAIFSFEKGRKDKVFSIYSEKEFTRKVETVYKASFFIDNPIERQVDSTKFDPVDSVYMDSDYFKYKERKYLYYSLIARYQPKIMDPKKDSICTLEVRDWLYNNDSIAVKKLMKDYFKIHKEYQLKSNLNPEKWYQAVFRAPNYVDYNQIFSYKSDNEEDAYTQNEYFGEKSSYFIEHDKLFDYYSTIIEEKDKKNIGIEGFLFLFYLGFALSLVILVFRTSNLLQWFLSVLIVFMIFIFNVFLLEIFNDENHSKYLIAIFTIIIEFFIIYLFTFVFKNKKKITTIAFNLFLCSFGFMLPLLFIFLNEFLCYHNNHCLRLFDFKNRNYNKDSFLVDVSSLNLLVIFIGMYFLCRYIRNQKAQPEN